MSYPFDDDQPKEDKREAPRLSVGTPPAVVEVGPVRKEADLSQPDTTPRPKPPRKKAITKARLAKKAKGAAKLVPTRHAAAKRQAAKPTKAKKPKAAPTKRATARASATAKPKAKKKKSGQRKRM